MPLCNHTKLPLSYPVEAHVMLAFSMQWRMARMATMGFEHLYPFPAFWCRPSLLWTSVPWQLVHALYHWCQQWETQSHLWHSPVPVASFVVHSESNFCGFASLPFLNTLVALVYLALCGPVCMRWDGEVYMIWCVSKCLMNELVMENGLFH